MPLKLNKVSREQVSTILKQMLNPLCSSHNFQRKEGKFQISYRPGLFLQLMMSFSIVFLQKHSSQNIWRERKRKKLLLDDKACSALLLLQLIHVSWALDWRRDPWLEPFCGFEKAIWDGCYKGMVLWWVAGGTTKEHLMEQLNHAIDH